MSEQGQPRARLQIVALLGLFAFPLVLATGLFVFAPDWRPWGTSNQGTLIIPPRSVILTGLEAIDGGRIGPEFLQGEWTLVVLSEACTDECQAQLYKIRQVRLGLGKDAPRVQRLYVSKAMGEPRSVPRFLEYHPGLRIAEADVSWFEQFSLNGSNPIADGRIYIIDPRGFLMMEYAREREGAAIRKDLKRLLKASQGTQ